MELTFEKFDGRRLSVEPNIDQDTGKEVGTVMANCVGFSGQGGIEIDLFDGNFKMTVNSYGECWGFVKGVEAALNHMLLPKRKRTAKAA